MGESALQAVQISVAFLDGRWRCAPLRTRFGLRRGRLGGAFWRRVCEP
jgi:hypothetical protein